MTQVGDAIMIKAAATCSREAIVEWIGTASVILPVQPTGNYPHTWYGEERRVPACLARDAKSRLLAAVYLPAPSISAKHRWTTLGAEQQRLSPHGSVSCREWETLAGRLVGDAEPETAARIDTALTEEVR